jgi:hypothetical protein
VPGYGFACTRIRGHRVPPTRAEAGAGGVVTVGDQDGAARDNQRIQKALQETGIRQNSLVMIESQGSRDDLCRKKVLARSERRD